VIREFKYLAASKNYYYYNKFINFTNNLTNNLIKLFK